MSTENKKKLFYSILSLVHVIMSLCIYVTLYNVIDVPSMKNFQAIHSKMNTISPKSGKFFVKLKIYFATLRNHFVHTVLSGHTYYFFGCLRTHQTDIHYFFIRKDRQSNLLKKTKKNHSLKIIVERTVNPITNLLQ